MGDELRGRPSDPNGPRDPQAMRDAHGMTEPRGVLAAFDELLKQPSAVVERARAGGTLRPALALLVGALACYGLYGAASGFFQGGGQVLLAALKTPLVVIFSVALCLPSLYILSALMGADITAKRLLVVVASFAGTIGIFMAGLLPITWLFSVSSRSLPFMVWLHLFLWAVTVMLAGRVLQIALRQMGARSVIAPWVALFLVVSFQSATLFRPLIWQPQEGPRFPGLREKMSFLEHFVRSMDPPMQADEAGGDANVALDALVGAEHGFARAASEKGVREAFREFLAPDAIGFRPTLGSAVAQLRAAPAPEQPTAAARSWTPRTGDISRAVDLGWLAGPYTLATANAAPQHGVYLSIWKRQADGSWRVLIETATPTPAPAASTFQGDGFVRTSQDGGRYTRRSAEDARLGLLDADRSIAQQAETMSLTNALLPVMDGEPRLHRPGTAPLVGREPIRAYLASQTTQTKFRPIDGGVSSSQDLGFTYGRYEKAPSAPNVEGESGYYVRVWNRWPSGMWTITADVTTPEGAR